MASNLKVFLTANTKKFERSLRKAQFKLRRFAKATKKFATLAAGAFIALGAVVAVKLAKSFIAFDKAMTNSLAIMNDVSPQMRKQMEETARTMSTKVTFSATELAESYFFLASAGLNAEQSMKSLGAVATFAQAGMFDMNQATELLVGSVKALGLASGTANETLKQTTRISDILVKANTLANATVEQFAQALGAESGAAMKAFNIPVEEGVGILAAFADKMVKGEKGGMLFSRFIKLLIPAVNNNKEAFKKFGIEVLNADGSLRPMADVIKSLEDGLGGMTAGVKSAALEQLGFKKKVQGAILPLLGSSEAVRKYTEELKDSAGFADKVAAKQLTSFSAQLALLGNNFDNIMAKLVNMSDVMPMIIDQITSFNDLIASNGQEWVNTVKMMWIETHAAWAKIIAVFQVAIDNYVTGFNWIGDNWGKLWTNAFDIVVSVFKDIVNAWTIQWKVLWEVAKGGWDLIKAIFTGGDVGQAFSKLLDNTVNTFIEGVAAVGSETEKALEKAGIGKLNLKGFNDISRLWKKIDQEKESRQQQLIDKAGEGLIKVSKQTNNITDETIKGAASVASKNRFAGAVEKGTVEAYRAEITRNSKGPESQTADNTSQMVELQKESLKEQKKANNKIVLGAGVQAFSLG